MGLSQVYYGSDPRKIAENNARNVAVQGDALLDANKGQQAQEAGLRKSTADYLGNIEDPLAQGKGGYDADEAGKIGLSSQDANQIRLTPEQQQNIVSSAGISAGAANAAAVGDATRAANATGGNPLALAAYRARAAQTEGANAGDAMTKARVAAQQAGAEGALAAHSAESSGAQAVGNARIGQQNQGLQYYQTQNEQANANEQGAAQRQAGIYGTETSGANQAAQTNVSASQTPSKTSQILGGIAGAVGGLVSHVADGDMMPGSDVVVGEAGPEKVIQMPQDQPGMKSVPTYRAATPSYMDSGGFSEAPETEGVPPGQEVQRGDDKLGWMARLRNSIRDNSGLPTGGAGATPQQKPDNSPGATYSKSGQQLGGAVGTLFQSKLLADGGSPDPGMPSETGIFTRPTHIKMQPGEAAVPLTYRANAKLRPSMAFKAPAVAKMGGVGGHMPGKHSYV